MHREVKQTKTECGAQKGLLQGPPKENRWLVLRRPELPPVGFREEGFIGKIWGESCRVCNPPLVCGKVTGWCSRNLNHQPSGSNQFGVHLLALSLKLPSSTWVGA